MLRRPKLKTEIGMKAKFNNELYFLYVCKTKEKFLSKIQKIIVQSNGAMATNNILGPLNKLCWNHYNPLPLINYIKITELIAITPALHL